MSLSKDPGNKGKESSKVAAMDAGSFQLTKVTEVRWTQNGSFVVILDAKSEDGLPLAVNIKLDMFTKALEAKGF